MLGNTSNLPFPLFSAALRECLPHPVSVSQSWVNKHNQVSANSLADEKGCWKQIFSSSAPFTPTFRTYPGRITASRVHSQKPNYMPLPQSSLSYILKILLLPDSGPTTETPRHSSRIHENFISVHFSFHTNSITKSRFPYWGISLHHCFRETSLSVAIV